MSNKVGKSTPNPSNFVPPIPVGTIGVTATFNGPFDNFIARAIQWFTATRSQYSGWSNAPVNHAFVYVGCVAGYEKPQIVEAEAGGAQFSDWDKYADSVIWLTDIRQCANGWYETVNDVPLVPTPEQQKKIAEYAIDCVIKHVGYGFLDFLGMALAQRRVGAIDPNNPPWWVKRLGDDSHLICSQLAAAAWHYANLIIYPTRIDGLVSPEDLYMAGGCPAHPAAA